MGRYLLRRILLVFPTLFGVMVINFIVVQFAPGGPVEQIVAEMMGLGTSATQNITAGGTVTEGGGGAYPGAQGVDPQFIAELEAQFGFDRPPVERFFFMMWNYIRLDFGESYFQDRPVTELVIERMPVSISLGLWSLILIYGISIPLGIAKAVRDGTKFDMWTSTVVFIGFAVPNFLFAILLIILFAGGFWDVFPMRGIVSQNWDELSPLAKVADYFWHLALPITALTVGGFATLTMLTKNSFLEEVNKQFVLTARAKGLTEKRVLYGHVFRNAMLIVIAGFPAALIGLLFTGALLIETIFSLEGLGLLGFEAVIQRDYPVMFGTLFFFTLLGLVLNIIGDITYVFVDPRIDFENRSV